jgi:hypothetical protein
LTCSSNDLGSYSRCNFRIDYRNATQIDGLFQSKYFNIINSIVVKYNNEVCYIWVYDVGDPTLYGGCFNTYKGDINVTYEFIV